MFLVHPSFVSYCFFFLSSALSGGYSNTSQAFIFSLHNKEGLEPFTAMVKDPAKAIFRQYSYGITFGAGYDLYIGGLGSQQQSSYARFGTSYSVTAEVEDPNTILTGTLFLRPQEMEMFYLHVPWP